MFLFQNIVKKIVAVLVVALCCSCSGNKKPFLEQLDADAEKCSRFLLQQATSDRITVQAAGDTVHSTRIADIENLNSLLKSNNIKDTIYFSRPYNMQFNAVKAVSTVFYFNRKNRILAFMANDKMYFIPKNFY